RFSRDWSSDVCSSDLGLATQFWRPLSALDRLDAQAIALLERVGLADARHALAADLSYGRKRALEIANTLALDPKVLLLDEPMAGMGHEDGHTLAALIADVAKDRAVLMVAHKHQVEDDISHHVTVLQLGEILPYGNYATVSHDERVRTSHMRPEHE